MYVASFIYLSEIRLDKHLQFNAKKTNELFGVEHMHLAVIKVRALSVGRSYV